MARDQHGVASGGTARRRWQVAGAVQGVGFRPFVYRLATDLGLAGFVENTPQGVTLEAEGPPERLEVFARRLRGEAPALARIDTLEAHDVAPEGRPGFAIRASASGGRRSALVLPDVATCADCRRELFDAADRRHRYPFVNCTQCGPRYSVILGLPYDRARTTMAGFALCARCRAEYEDPLDRRFHAEPTACPECGPRLELADPGGAPLALRDRALREGARALREGRIVALLGLGGFQLLVDARDGAAVRRLRERKQREAKPLALMAAHLAQARELCRVEAAEERLLESCEAPIVILRRRADGARLEVAEAVAPGHPHLGVMLPYTPLHLLVMAELGFPVVATSGNRSDEPICTDPREALARIGGIADLFLFHDRPVARPVDDSVVRLVAGRPLLLRRARGYAPAPVATLPGPPVLAVGAHLKNAVALSTGERVVLSPHVGDLDTAPAVAHFRHTIEALGRLLDVRPQLVACDAHPDYASTQQARATGLPAVTVQHHHAHALACLADNGLEPPALALTWDGSGWGPDGTVWGGEALRVRPDGGYERVARLRPFPLPGGEAAVREPRRSALGLLFALEGPGLLERDADPLWRLFRPREREVLGRMLQRGLNCPRTSSVGRLFDGLAALCGLYPVAGFEGQAAMALEGALDPEAEAAAPYPLPLLQEGQPAELDWGPLLQAARVDLAGATPVPVVSARFHAALAAGAVAMAARAGEGRVLLSGGCFQNRALTEGCLQVLRAAGFEAYWHRQVPPNDGGLALGQVWAALRAPRG